MEGAVGGEEDGTEIGGVVADEKGGEGIDIDFSVAGSRHSPAG